MNIIPSCSFLNPSNIAITTVTMGMSITFNTEAVNASFTRPLKLFSVQFAPRLNNASGIDKFAKYVTDLCIIGGRLILKNINGSAIMTDKINGFVMMFIRMFLII